MKRYQQGFVVVTSLVMALSMAVLIYVAFAAALSTKEAGRAAEKELEWVRDTQQKLDAWYAINKAAIDADAAQIPISVVLSGAGITVQYGAQYASSVRLASNGVEYHNIVFWIPKDGVSGTGLDVTTGAFNPGTLTGGAVAPTNFVMVHGLDIETRAYISTTSTVRRIATSFELYFQAKFTADPDSDSSINYFRAASCPSPVDGELPCVDAYTDIMSSGMETAVGLSSLDATDEWGGAIQVSNLDGITAGDHAISIQAVTPWGTAIQAIGVGS